MKIFRLWQEINRGYDTYLDCVVVAEDIDDAKTIPPDYDSLIFPDELPGTERKNRNLWVHRTLEKSSGWVSNVNQVFAEEIGEANGFQRRGVICANFRAG